MNQYLINLCRMCSQEKNSHVCPRCKVESRSIDCRPMAQVHVEGTKLDVEDSFCFLGDLLCSVVCCESVIAARFCVTWGTSRKSLLVLTARHLSPMRGKVYKACVRSTMPHGSRTWGPNILDLEQLCRNDRTVIRWICGTKDRAETSPVSLFHKLGIKDFISVLRSGRLRWYGHVQHVTNLPIPGPRRKGRHRKTWSKCVKTALTLSQCTLAGPVYTVMPLKCHWLTQCTLGYHWATQRILAG